MDINPSRASVPAVTDLDLDGQQEVIVGDGRYDIDGNTIAYHQPDGIDPFSNTASDAMISIITWIMIPKENCCDISQYNSCYRY